MRELLFDRLDLRDVTLVGQDWGGLIGLRLVGEHPDRFARVVAANTFLPTGDTNPGEAFFAWQRFSQEVEVFPTGGHRQRRLRQPTWRPRSGRPTTRPFPDESYKAGARAVPHARAVAARRPGPRRQRGRLGGPGRLRPPLPVRLQRQRPHHRGADRTLKERIAGAQGQPHTTIAGGGHFLQEDWGEELAQVVVDFVASTP